MTPKRKAALQWFHDRGEASLRSDIGPSFDMCCKMITDQQIKAVNNVKPWFKATYCLTDKGRRMLHGDAS